MNFTKTLWVLTLIFTSLAAKAQTGSISGIITDGRDSTNKPIFGAQVFIAGTTYGAFTGMNGEYTLTNVAPGKYDITVSYVLIGEQKIEGVKVEAQQNTVANLPMGENINEEVGIRVVLHKNKESEAAAVNEMKNSDEVVEIVSNKEMSAKGDNKASDAAKRVTGVSIVEDKYAYIRGLSDRYSKTLINGSEVPGLDPDRIAVQLDLFPSLFIQSMNVVKTFSPDMPADFTGGLIDIKTRENYDTLTYNVSLGTSYNPQVHFNKDYLLYKGGKTDFLGFDDGTRDFTQDIKEVFQQGQEASFISPEDVSKDRSKKVEYENFQSGLNPQMEPENMTKPLGHNFSFTMGNTISKERKNDTLKAPRKIGYLAGVNYRRSYSYYNNGRVSSYFLDAGSIDQDSMLTSRRGVNIEEGGDNVLLGGIGSLFYRFNEKNKIKLTAIHNHTGTSSASYGEGSDFQVPNSEFRIRSLSYTQRSMNTIQLSGLHNFDTLFLKTPTDIDWIISSTFTSQKQPDLRFLLDIYDRNIDQYRIVTNLTAPTRFFRQMNQQSYDAKLNLTKKFKTDSAEIIVKTGGSALLQTRRFEEGRIFYSIYDNDYEYSGNGNDLVSPDRFNIDFDTVDTRTSQLITASSDVVMQNQMSDENQYDATKLIGAYYLMGEIPLSKKFNLITGARTEYTYMHLVSDSKKADAPIGELKNLDILPSVNLTYNIIKGRTLFDKKDSTRVIKKDLKLQFVYGRTIARPNFREIAPFKVNNFFQKYDEIGNSELKRTLIDNLDLRFEYYPNTGELIAVSFFFKYFDGPIERTSNPETAELEYTWRNAPKAVLYGTEIEFRRSLEFISPNLKNFKSGINLAILTSRVDINEKELRAIQLGNPFYKNDYRTLLGQSPFLGNVFLEYKLDSIGLSTNLTYNMFGERLTLVQEEGLPNVWERGRGELNLNISKKLSNRSKITLRARNLLNPAYEFYYKFEGDADIYDKYLADGDYIFRSYKKGRSYSLSYSYIF